MQSRAARKDRFSSDQLRNDAPDTPHIRRLPVILRAKQHLRRTIPPSCHVLRQHQFRVLLSDEASHKPKIAYLYCFTKCLLSQEGLMSMLLDFISRCITCAECRYFITLHSWYAMKRMCVSCSIFSLNPLKNTPAPNAGQSPRTQTPGRYPCRSWP